MRRYILVWEGSFTGRGADTSPLFQLKRSRIWLSGCEQSDKISHIDTVISHIDTVILWSIFHIDTVIFHIDTVILRSLPYRYCDRVIWSTG